MLAQLLMLLFYFVIFQKQKLPLSHKLSKKKQTLFQNVNNDARVPMRIH